MQIFAALCFLMALLHTFSTHWFKQLETRYTKHAGFWHLLGEVELAFMVWSLIFLLGFCAQSGLSAAVDYLNSCHFTEAMLVFVLMVLSGTQSIRLLLEFLIQTLARWLPFAQAISLCAVVLIVLPLLGSLVTEPAAMTLAALFLKEHFYQAAPFKTALTPALQYGLLAVLLVNVSIGGTLTHFAAPPVLMVAGPWGWTTLDMFLIFGWKASIAVLLNTILLILVFRKELSEFKVDNLLTPKISWPICLVHVGFLAATVYFSNEPVVFVGIFLFFLGFVRAYPQYQSPLLMSQGLLVACFLAGLVILGGQQRWWLQPLISSVPPYLLYPATVCLTAFTDNAALTYLGTFVQPATFAFQYALVAGAVTGGGLTMVANAPNPTAFAFLKNHFPNAEIRPWPLFCAAIGPTVVAFLIFLYL